MDMRKVCSQFFSPCKLGSSAGPPGSVGFRRRYRDVVIRAIIQRLSIGRLAAAAAATAAGGRQPGCDVTLAETAGSEV